MRSDTVAPPPAKSRCQVRFRRELVGRGIGVAPAPRREAQGHARLQQVRRQLAPLPGQARLLGIDRDALDGHEAQRRPRLEDPHLAGGGRGVLPAGGHREDLGAAFAHDRRLARLERELVGARPHLHAERAVGLEAHGQRARRGRRPRTRAAAPGPTASSRAGPETRKVIRVSSRSGTSSVTFRCSSTSMRRSPRLLLLPGVPQPEAAELVALGEGDVLAAEAQRDDPRLPGHGEQRGKPRPDEAAAHLVEARLEAQLGAVADQARRRRRPVDAHVLGPALGVAGQREGAPRVDPHLLHEAPAVLAELEGEATRPGAAPLAAPVEERAERLLVAAERPGDPRAQRLGHVRRREALGRRRPGDRRGERQGGEAGGVADASPQNSSSFVRQRLASRALLNWR